MLWLALPLMCAEAFGAPTAHVRSADGRWTQAQVQDLGEAIVVRIGPELATAGSATLVVNKPDWMQLEDDAAPMAVAARLGEQGLSVEGGIDLGALGSTAPQLVLRVADAANPIDPASLRVLIPGNDAPVQLDASALAVPSRTGEVSVQLPGMKPGAYQGTLSIADLSPQANTLRLPLRFTVFGIEPDVPGSRIALASPAASFQVTAQSKLPLLVEAAGQTVYVTGQVGGTWMYPREMRSAEMIEDTPERAVCRVTTGVGTDTGAEIDKPGTYEYELEVRKDLPCLLVTSRLLNEVADGDVYCFWGWPGGDGFHTEAGRQEWSMTYADLGKVGWVYLPPQSAGKSGIGWISPLVFGQSRFGTMLLYTSPQRLPCKAGEKVSMRFAIMPASSPDEVRAVAEKIEELGVWE